MNAAIHHEVQRSGIWWPYEAQQQPCVWPKEQQQTAILEHLEKQMLEFVAQHREALAHVSKHYVLNTDAAVRQFLTDHRTLPAILLEALPHLHYHFGRGLIFTLRAPLDEAGSQTLYAVVLWPGTPRDVRQALEDFDNNWWLARCQQATGNLTFTYELV